LLVGAGEFGDVTIGQMFANNLIPVTIGNYIGALALALIMYFCYKAELPSEMEKAAALANGGPEGGAAVKVDVAKA